jgi:hypothetical protein
VNNAIAKPLRFAKLRPVWFLVVGQGDLLQVNRSVFHQDLMDDLQDASLLCALV